MKIVYFYSDKSDELAASIAEFENSKINIENPREEASQIMKYLCQTLMEHWTTKVAGATFSRILMMRRQQYEHLVGNYKGARTQLKRLQPDCEFLYGDKVGIGQPLQGLGGLLAGENCKKLFQ